MVLIIGINENKVNNRFGLNHELIQNNDSDNDNNSSSLYKLYIFCIILFILFLTFKSSNKDTLKEEIKKKNTIKTQKNNYISNTKVCLCVIGKKENPNGIGLLF